MGGKVNNLKPEEPTPLDKFGKFIVHCLRDRALEQNELLIAGKLQGRDVQRLQARLQNLDEDQKRLIRDIATDLLDTAMHDVLFAIQDAHDRCKGLEVLSDGQNIAELSEALQGEPFGPDGWIARFSRFSQ